MRSSYKKVSILNFSGFLEKKRNVVHSSLYEDNIKIAINTVSKNNLIKKIDWKNPDLIKDKDTKKIFDEVRKNRSKRESVLIYELFIEVFFAKFVFCNDLLINLDSVRLFQVDFLGWTARDIES